MAKKKRNVDVTGNALRHCFCAWIRGWRPEVRFSVLQPSLAEMTQPLPEDICPELGFSPGTSVDHAARCIIVINTRDGERRINTTIGFKTEQESMEWWERNKDNPERVSIKPTGSKAHITEREEVISDEVIPIAETGAATFEVKIAP